MKSLFDRALIGRKSCGCVVAADLDGHSESADRYIRLGYSVETVSESEAKRMLRESNCQHR